MRLRSAFVFFSAAVCIFVLAGCDEAGVNLSKDEGAPATVARTMGLQAAPAPMPPPSEDLGEATPAEPEGRRIIRSMSITIEVKDVASSGEKARAIASSSGGFVADSSASEDDAGRRRFSMTLRIPEGRLDETSAELKKLGHVRDETTRGEDVTEQYVDLEARLANSKRLEERMLDLLTKQSKSLKDVLDVERELARVRERIETMVARKRFLDDRLALSTVELTLIEPPGWGRGIFDPLGGLLQRTLSTLTSSLAVLVVVLAGAAPWVVVLFVLGWLMVRLLRWRIRRKRAEKAKKGDAPPL